MSRGWGSRRGEGEGGSRGSPGVFFFHRGSTIDPLNFSLLLAPPTPTAISHFSFFLSLSIPLWFSFLFVSAFPPFLASVAIMSCALPNFFTSPLLSSLLSLSPFSLSRSYGIFIRRVIFRLWTECFRCYRRRESRWLIDSFALSFKRFCKLIFSHSMLPYAIQHFNSSGYISI